MELWVLGSVLSLETRGWDGFWQSAPVGRTQGQGEVSSPCGAALLQV